MFKYFRVGTHQNILKFNPWLFIHHNPNFPWTSKTNPLAIKPAVRSHRNHFVCKNILEWHEYLWQQGISFVNQVPSQNIVSRGRHLPLLTMAKNNISWVFTDFSLEVPWLDVKFFAFSQTLKKSVLPWLFPDNVNPGIIPGSMFFSLWHRNQSSVMLTEMRENRSLSDWLIYLVPRQFHRRLRLHSIDLIRE